MNLLPWDWHRDVQFDGPELSHEITLHSILEDENPATRAVCGSSGQSPAQAGAQIQGLLLSAFILLCGSSASSIYELQVVLIHSSLWAGWKAASFSIY